MTSATEQPARPGAAPPAGPGLSPSGPAGTRIRARRSAAGGWPLSTMTAVAIAVMVLFSLAAIIVGSLALAGLSSAQGRVVNKLSPSTFQASQLYAALLNQETAVRGYLLSADPSFLQPYQLGLSGQRTAVARLDQLLPGLPTAQADVALVLRRAGHWRADYVQPVVQQVRTSGKPLVSPTVRQGKAEFDGVRAPLARLQAYLKNERAGALAKLHSSEVTLDIACIAIAVGLLAIVTVLILGIRRAAVAPLSRLAADARTVSDGDFDHRVAGTGPRELQELGVDVDEMRLRIVAELSAVRRAHETLEARTLDLQRSNAELEQFAYVASHDLQEPLRKVASFCQLLQRRYGGQLDERADQYIEYAVDGAKRMQVLINDLLAFSRVGRSAANAVPVSCAKLAAQAEANLATAITESGAVIEAGELPVVLGEPALLTAVFQNLIGNALKFRQPDAPPHVTIAAEREGDSWEFVVTDNGIGISPEYADRIFVIFQRLHDKSTYSGTGIGLAMCRKIIEYYGGRIWLDTSYAGGSRFRFTLPVLAEETPADE
jgi:signal transduction histidine kinase